MSQMTPQEIVHELDKHIIGQEPRQARGRDRAEESLAPAAGGGTPAPRNYPEETSS